MHLEIRREIRQGFGAILERPELRALLDAETRAMVGRVIEHDIGFEAQLGCRGVEAYNRDTVAEDVMNPVNVGGHRVDLQLGTQQSLLLAVAWPKQQPMLTEADRLRIIIGRRVPDTQDCHLSPRDLL